jgi:hypothetical protein
MPRTLSLRQDLWCLAVETPLSTRGQRRLGPGLISNIRRSLAPCHASAGCPESVRSLSCPLAESSDPRGPAVDSRLGNEASFSGPRFKFWLVLFLPGGRNSDFHPRLPTNCSSPSPETDLQPPDPECLDLRDRSCSVHQDPTFLPSPLGSCLGASVSVSLFSVARSFQTWVFSSPAKFGGFVTDQEFPFREHRGSVIPLPFPSSPRSARENYPHISSSRVRFYLVPTRVLIIVVDFPIHLYHNRHQEGTQRQPSPRLSPWRKRGMQHSTRLRLARPAALPTRTSMKPPRRPD